MVCGGTALLIAADKIIAKGKKLAAHVLEAAEHDIVFEDGKFVVAGTDKSIGLTEIATAIVQSARRCRRAWRPACSRAAPSTAASAPFRTAATLSRSRSTRTTGAVELVRYCAVDDVGHMINPMLVEGQLHGGIAQGVGQALIENIVYQGGPDRHRLVHGLRHAACRQFLRVRARRERSADQDSIRSASRARANPARSARCRR